MGNLLLKEKKIILKKKMLPMIDKKYKKMEKIEQPDFNNIYIKPIQKPKPVNTKKYYA
jgi:hypothetical protein